MRFTRRRALAGLAGAGFAMGRARADVQDWPRVLVVVPGPGDDCECAVSLYRIVHELGGVVDEAVMSAGDSSAGMSRAAEAYYQVSRSSGDGGLSRLGQIRREEAVHSGRVLGIRRHYFLDLMDHPASGVEDVLRCWDAESGCRQLATVMEAGDYRFVITLLPAEDSDAMRKATALLVLQAAGRLPARRRPALLAVRAAGLSETPLSFPELRGYPVTRTTNDTPVFTVNRLDALDPKTDLDYTMIANWALAEHKSRGLLQAAHSRDAHEQFWSFDATDMRGLVEVQELFTELRKKRR
jgi:LmbE family N-acetylglucosaminyl deacetylase